MTEYPGDTESHSRWKPPRIVTLVAALVALAFWIVLDDRPQSDSGPARTLVASTPHASVGSGISVSTVIPSEFPARDSLSKSDTDPFAPQFWVAPKSPPSSKSIMLVAPPFPYRFVGRLLKDGEVQFYLERDDDIFPVRKGETVDGSYRVELIDANSVTLLHLPSGTRQTIATVTPNK